MTNFDAILDQQSPSKTVNRPKFIAFGNVLLDLSVQTSDNEVLKKFELSKDDQAEVPIAKLHSIVSEAMERYDNVTYNPGGSALNTCRIMKALGDLDLLFFGSVGNDENGVILKNILQEAHLDNCLQTLENQNTGTCICLINGTTRSLVANIGAALNFQKQHLITMDNQLEFSRPPPEDTIQKPQIFYIEGYFIPQKFDICKYIYETYCHIKQNLLAVNLNASYVCHEFPNEIKYLVAHADIVISNVWEMSALTKICDFDSNTDTVKYFFTKYPRTDRQKLFIITHGADNVQTYIGTKTELTHEQYKVVPVPKDEIVDTTGAGDSFVAGFLYAYFAKKSLAECVLLGCDTAAKVIRQVGVVLPNDH